MTVTGNVTSLNIGEISIISDLTGKIDLVVVRDFLNMAFTAGIAYLNAFLKNQRVAIPNNLWDLF